MHHGRLEWIVLTFSHMYGEVQKECGSLGEVTVSVVDFFDPAAVADPLTT